MSKILKSVKLVFTLAWFQSKNNTFLAVMTFDCFDYKDQELEDYNHLCLELL